MKVQFSCACGKKFSAEKDLAGKAIRCKNCDELVEIPFQSEAIVIKAVAVEPTHDDLPLPEIPDVGESLVPDQNDLSQVPVGYAPVSPAAYMRPMTSSSKPRKKRASNSSSFPLAIVGIALSVVGVLAVLGVGAVVLSRMDFSPTAVATNADGLSMTVHPDDTSRSISEEEALKVASRFAEAVSRRDINLCVFLFDVDKMYSKAISDIAVSDSFRGKMTEEFKREGVGKRLLNNVIGSVTSGSYVALNQVLRDGEQRVICRLMAPNNSLNYHELMFTRSAGGEVEIRDIVSYQAGESFGTTVRNLSLLNAAIRDRSLWKRLSG